MSTDLPRNDREQRLTEAVTDAIELLETGRADAARQRLVMGMEQEGLRQPRARRPLLLGGEPTRR